MVLLIKEFSNISSLLIFFLLISKDENLCDFQVAFINHLFVLKTHIILFLIHVPKIEKQSIFSFLSNLKFNSQLEFLTVDFLEKGLMS